MIYLHKIQLESPENKSQKNLERKSHTHNEESQLSKPEFTHQVFPEKKISGYRDLQINLLTRDMLTCDM